MQALAEAQQATDTLTRSDEPVEPASVEEAPAQAAREEQSTMGKSPRLISLDAFRGFTILGMLLVNNVGLSDLTPRQLTHADWTGRVHFADFIFPWFLFIVGVALPWASLSAKRRGVRGWRYAHRVVSRTAVLFLLGCLIHSAIARQPVIDLGVLQLIGLAYCAGAFLLELPWVMWLPVAAGLLTAHWALLKFLSVPGYGAGTVTEEVNAVRYLNDRFLAAFHLRGLLSVIPTTAMVLIGASVGKLLAAPGQGHARKAILTAVAGVFLALAGLLWSVDLPMSKPLWTAPYILYTAGWGAVILALMYCAVDWAGWRWIAFPFTVAGVNAIFAYVAPILVKVMVLQTWKWPLDPAITLEHGLQSQCAAVAGGIWGAWLYTFGYIACWWLILLYLYQKKIYIRA
ncbi:MAG: DUF1624 domain-containing protein [Armatimonadetes bacterium]|nr:DUF1624 domain-containing protein [Armatimonadota bacterium]